MRLRDELFEVTARVEQILHLDTMALGSNSDLADMLRDDELLALLGVQPCDSDLYSEALDDDELDEALADYLAAQPEIWLVQVATPVMRREAGIAIYSWGNFRTQWFRASSYEEAVRQGIAWAKEQQAVDARG